MVALNIGPFETTVDVYWNALHSCFYLFSTFCCSPTYVISCWSSLCVRILNSRPDASREGLGYISESGVKKKNFKSFTSKKNSRYQRPTLSSPKRRARVRCVTTAWVFFSHLIGTFLQFWLSRKFIYGKISTMKSHNFKVISKLGVALLTSPSVIFLP